MQKKDQNDLPAQTSLCPNCRFPVSPEDTFCGECGFDLTQETAAASSQAPGGEGPVDDETGELQARVDRFTAPRNLRRSYFDLGLALKAQARYREAAEVFGQALQAEGGTPKDVDILYQQAYAYEQGANPERAFRVYLEAVGKDPGEADIVLPHIHHMASSKIVLENGVWLVSDWAQSIERIRVSPADRAHISSFLGRIHLFLGQYEPALAAFQQALQADPQIAPAVITKLITPAYLPPEFDPKADNGQAYFMLARIWQLLGNVEEALRTVEMALSLNLGEGSYLVAPVQRLKADLLAQTGQKAAAAQWYYEAGRRYSWREENDTASRLLELAVTLKKDYPEACWAWMDAERARAYLDAPPFADQKAVERSLRAWRIGLSSGWPEVEYFWAYTTRALLCELEARLDPARRIDYWWDAIRWLEVALILDPKDAYSWAYLGRFFRYLNLESNGELVGRRTIELDKDNLAVLEERAALLANRGQFDEAGQVINRRRELKANAWADAVAAYIFMSQGTAAAAQALYLGLELPTAPPWLSKYEEALRILEQLLASAPDDSWYHEMRTLCLRALPQRAAEAQAEAQRLYAICSDPQLADNKDVRFSRGWAAFVTGRVEEAVSLYESFLDDAVLSGSAQRNLGICRLAQGKWEQGEQDLLQGLAKALNPRECDDAINDLQEAHHLPTALYARLRERIAARRAELQQFPSAMDEIRAAMQRIPAGKPGQIMRNASTAVQARLALDAKDYTVALSAYQQLAMNDFPVKERAMNQAMDTWEGEIDALLKEKRYADASRELLRMEPFIPATDQPHRLAELYARLTLAAFSRDQAGEGQQYFTRTVELGNEAQWVAAGEQIGDVWRNLLSDPAQLWRVDGLLHGIGKDAVLAQEAASTRHSLQPFLDTYYQLGREIKAEEDPYCLPVLLWVGSRLVELVDPGVSRKFIYDDIPALRKRIQNTLGISIPAVRVRDDQNMTTGYQIDLYEQAAASGEVFLDMRFCGATPAELDVLKIPRKSYRQAANPFTGGSGCWVAEKYSQTVIAANWTLTSPSEYMLAHLESVLRSRLADFVGIAEAERLLDGLDARWEDLMERSLPDMAARLGLARLLRALVREHVPVTHLPEILQAGANGGLGDPAQFAEMLRAARLRLINQLPGNQGERKLPVPPEWEKQTEEWGSLKSPSASELAELLSAVSDWTSGSERPGVLLVESARLRPYLRRLIEDRFPDWPVLSREETLRSQSQA